MAKILICDDSIFMRMLLKGILVPAGHSIVGEASNGWEAVELYQSCKPELVTMDITMKELDGITALKKIKTQDPQAKVIMVSSMGQQEIIVSALKAGASDFIIKPFSEERILEIIGHALIKKVL
ncbi:MAG: response regulator with CheY-like receiver, AAA-type ATPase, and DNA-binding domain [Firmicutes bacterium]|nr:response regulator with CheY-like receiver, AAA-type ATPase, and DNA-binding domain [Bacillota bacterium]